MENEIRDSGIDVIGNVPWGTHLCQFYQTKEDLKHILIPYLKTGLENNEFCIWIASKPLDKEEAKAALKKTVPDIDVYLEKGQIEIIPHADWYTKEGVFDSQKALNNLTEKASQSLASGYDGLRFIENICWLDNKSWNDFVNYEERLDSATGMYPVIALCTYPLEMCSVTDIIDIVTNHQFILSRKNGKWEKTENTGMKITAECTQVEQTLRETELQYKSLYENSLDGILLTRPDGTILSANPQACYLFGMTENEIIQAGREGLVVRDERLAAALEERELTGRMNAELTCRRKDGSTFVCNVTSNLFEDAYGSIKTSMIVRDITGNKQAEEALRKNEERYRMLFTNMTEGFLLGEIICDESDRPYDYRYLELNPAFELETGVKKEEVLGKSALEVFHRVPQIEIEEFGKVALSGESTHFESYAQPTDKYFEIYSFSPEKGKFAVIFRDISRRKQIEKKLQESERQQRGLAQSIDAERARLEAVLENLPVGVWIADINGQLIGKNKEADRIWVGSAPLLESIEEYPQYTSWYADSDKLLASEEYPVARTLLTGQPVAPIELNIRRFDGTRGTVLVSSAPIKSLSEKWLPAITFTTCNMQNGNGYSDI